MSNPSDLRTRRRFFRYSALGLAVTPILRSSFAQDAQKKRVDSSSPQAKALNFVEDAKQAKDPKRKPDQFCHNCQFFQGKATDASAPCTIFQNQLVAGPGWCSSWIAKPAG